MAWCSGFAGRHALLFAPALGFGFLVLADASCCILLAQTVAGQNSPSVAQQTTTKSEATGTIEGLVTFRGEIPRSSVPDDVGVRRELLQVDRQNAGLRYTVVWLVTDNPPAKEGLVTRTFQSASHDAWKTGATSSLAEVRARLTQVDQIDYEFVPRVLAVRTRQLVRFTNSDTANHNVRTSSSRPTNEFNVFTGVDGSYTHRFAADPRQRPVQLGCDIHPWMRGWIYVFEHPYFAVTDERGRFQIGGVPPGQYQLEFRQPDVRCTGARSVVVASAQKVSVRIEIPAECLKDSRE